MSSNTTNLDLYKYDTGTDGQQYFNVDEALNQNLDKIDEKLGAQVVASPAKTPVSLDGQQVITSPRVAPYNVKSIKGQTRVNLLGRDGGFESISRYFPFQSAIAIDTANYTTGKNGLKVTVANGYASGAGATNQAFNFYAGRKYILLGDVKNGNAAGVQIQMTSLLPSGIAVIPLVSDTTKWTTVYKKFSPNADTSTSGFNAVVSGAGGTYGYFDSCRVYELSDAEYDAIDSMTAEQIAAKYPYVDDIKPIMNPYAIKHGENLFPTLYECITSSPSPLAIIGPYKGIITSLTANTEWVAANIPAAPNQDYTLSGFGAVAAHTYVHLYDKNGVLTDSFYVPKGSVLPVTFTTKATTATLQVGVQPTSAGSYAIDLPMLNLGSIALPFKPREDDYLILPAKLHSNIDRSVYDEITYHDGKYWKNSRFKEQELDGGLLYVYNSAPTGQKIVSVPAEGIIYNNGNLFGVKYDGKILRNIEDYTVPDSVYATTDSAVSGRVYITIPNTDSGWGESYQPTQAEIQAYFWGWKMYVDGGDTSNPYNGTGRKGWIQRGYQNNPGHVVFDNPPTYLSPSFNEGKFTLYKLIYQLATPTTEVIPVEGGITLHEGLNQLEVGAGMVVREKVSLTSDTSYQINIKGHPTIPDSNLSMRLGVLFDIYKNEKPDKAAWTSVKDAYSYGNWRYRSSNADPAAAYTVTYLPLDLYQLTGTVQAIEGEYSTNLKTTVDTLARSQADVLTRVSVLESQKAGKEQPQWIYPTLLRGFASFGGVYEKVAYFKDTAGIVHINGIVINGISGDSTKPIFRLPIRYRPYRGIIRAVVARDAANANDIVVRLEVWPTGEVFITNNATLAWISLEDVSFLAEY